MLGISKFSYEALVKEPIVQNLISLMELLSPKTVIMKFAKAENKAFTTVPANISLVDVHFAFMRSNDNNKECGNDCSKERTN